MFSIFSEKYEFTCSAEWLFWRNTVIYLQLVEIERIWLFCLSTGCMFFFPNKCSIHACSLWCICLVIVISCVHPCCAVVFFWYRWMDWRCMWRQQKRILHTGGSVDVGTPTQAPQGSGHKVCVTAHVQLLPTRPWSDLKGKISPATQPLPGGLGYPGSGWELFLQPLCWAGFISQQSNFFASELRGCFCLSSLRAVTGSWLRDNPPQHVLCGGESRWWWSAC